MVFIVLLKLRSTVTFLSRPVFPKTVKFLESTKFAPKRTFAYKNRSQKSVFGNVLLWHSGSTPSRMEHAKPRYGRENCHKSVSLATSAHPSWPIYMFDALQTAQKGVCQALLHGKLGCALLAACGENAGEPKRVSPNFDLGQRGVFRSPNSVLIEILKTTL